MAIKPDTLNDAVDRGTSWHGQWGLTEEEKNDIALRVTRLHDDEYWRGLSDDLIEEWAARRYHRAMSYLHAREIERATVEWMRRLRERTEPGKVVHVMGGGVDAFDDPGAPDG